MDSETLVSQPPGAYDRWFDRFTSRVNQLIADLAAAGLDVLAAGWLQTTYEGRPYLHLVLPAVEAGQTYETYVAIQPVLRAAGVRRIRLTEIRLVGPSAPLGRAILGATRSHPDPDGEPYVCPESAFHGVSIVGHAIIFTPKPAPAAGD